MKRLSLLSAILSCLILSALPCGATGLFPIDITNEDETVSYDVTAFRIGGSNEPEIVGTMWWTNDLSGDNGTRSAVELWQISGIDLDVGANSITVTGEDADEIEHSDSVTITREAAGLESPIVDIGTSSGTRDYDIASILLSGTNNAHVLGTMWVSNAANSEAYSFDASLDWQTPAISLVVGANVITVSGTNLQSQTTNDAITITRQTKDGSDDDVTYYVATDGLHIPPFANWANAATQIQSAVETATDNDIVLVTNGVYDTGGTRVHPALLTNRVYITNAITVKSVNGADVTSIVGASDNGTNGPAAVRCVYMVTNSVLAGFTLTNGYTLRNTSYADMCGGGVFLHHGGTVSHCVISGNSAGGGDGVGGGGAFCDNGGTLNNCTVSGNSTLDCAGGIYLSGGTANNCLITGNTAQSWGGACMFWSQGTMNNCTIVDNTAGLEEGGGVYLYNGGTLNNCIVVSNAPGGVENIEGNSGYTIRYTCSPGLSGDGNITNDPQFVDAANGNYQLSSNSPCIDTGTNSYVVGTNDLAGNTRIIRDIVDMGAYEYVYPPIETYYVSTNSAVDGPGWAWSNAFWTIQGAVNVASNENTILVTNGVYDAGGAKASGCNLTNRVYINKTITVCGINGRSNTFIVGAADPSNTNGPAAVRCVYLGNGGILTGFTLTHGHSGVSGPTDDELGGGLFLQSSGSVLDCTVSGCSAIDGGAAFLDNGGTLSGCTLEGCSADDHAGGLLLSQNGMVSNCMLSGNTANSQGGGVYFSDGGTLDNCTLTNNVAEAGGGAYCDDGGLLTNCTIAGNTSLGDSPPSGGGGVYCWDGGTLRNCRIFGNDTGEDGGGVCCYYGGTISGCSVWDNAGDDQGGGVFGFSGDSITNSMLWNNSSYEGGGVYFYNSGVLANSILSNNVASAGGGVYLNDGTEATGCTITSNSAVVGGGIFFSGGGTSTVCSLTYNAAHSGGGAFCSYGGTLNHCELRGNTATDDGGATYMEQGGTLNNCTLIDNASGALAGGMFFKAGGTANNCTLSENVAATNGGGVYYYQGGTLNNCIVSGNTPGGTNNIEGYGSCTSRYTCCPGLSGNGNITNDPQFLDADYEDYRLRHGSPCRDAGSNGWAVDTNDLDGKPRIVNGTVDMGAYEQHGLLAITHPAAGTEVVGWGTPDYDIMGTNTPSIIGELTWTNRLTEIGGTVSAAAGAFDVSSVSLELGNNFVLVSGTNAAGEVIRDSVEIDRKEWHGGASPTHYAAAGGGDVWPYTNWNQAAESLQDAVTAAAPGDTVLATNGVYDTGDALTPDYDLPNRVMINKAIAVRGLNGSDNTTIIGLTSGAQNGATAVRCAYVGSGGVLDGFTLSSGCTRTSGTDPEKTGGGVFISGGGTVAHCAVVECTAWHGGGASIGYSGGTLTDCEIFGNHAAVWAGGLLMLGHSTMARRCGISSNDCNDKGGGVHIYHGGELVNCLVENNDAGNYGGGVYLNDGGVVMHCTVVDNDSDRGGGLYFYDDEGSVTNSIIYGNTASISGTNIHNSAGCRIVYSCSPDGVTHGVNDCITNHPQFVGGVDYRLDAASLCIDAGHNLAGVVDDLDGVPRPLDGDTNGTATVDMGCYEYVSATADSDGDGLTDGDEVSTYGTSPTLENTDGDVHSDYEEMITGTDGADSNSYFHVSQVDDTASCVITFDCTNSRNYSLLYSTNLVVGSWSAVSGQTDVTGSGSSMSLTDTVDSVHRSYRVGVSLP